MESFEYYVLNNEILLRVVVFFNQNITIYDSEERCYMGHIAMSSYYSYKKLYDENKTDDIIITHENNIIRLITPYDDLCVLREKYIPEHLKIPSNYPSFSTEFVLK
jgi:hypothetical protein